MAHLAGSYNARLWEQRRKDSCKVLNISRMTLYRYIQTEQKTKVYSSSDDFFAR